MSSTIGLVKYSKKNFLSILLSCKIHNWTFNDTVFEWHFSMNNISIYGRRWNDAACLRFLLSSRWTFIFFAHSFFENQMFLDVFKCFIDALQIVGWHAFVLLPITQSSLHFFKTTTITLFFILYVEYEIFRIFWMFALSGATTCVKKLFNVQTFGNQLIKRRTGRHLRWHCEITFTQWLITFHVESKLSYSSKFLMPFKISHAIQNLSCHSKSLMPTPINKDQCIP